MRSHISTICDVFMIVTLLVMAVVSLVKDEYSFGLIFASLSSVQGDLLRNRLRQEG